MFLPLLYYTSWIPSWTAESPHHDHTTSAISTPTTPPQPHHISYKHTPHNHISSHYISQISYNHTPHNHINYNHINYTYTQSH